MQRAKQNLDTSPSTYLGSPSTWLNNISSNRNIDLRGSDRYGIYIAERRTSPAHTEARAADIISFKVACNPPIAETITRLAHIESGVTDILSLKVACNPPGKMVVDIAGSGGLCEVDGRIEQAQVYRQLP